MAECAALLHLRLLPVFAGMQSYYLIANSLTSADAAVSILSNGCAAQ